LFPVRRCCVLRSFFVAVYVRCCRCCCGYVLLLRLPLFVVSPLLPLPVGFVYVVGWLIRLLFTLVLVVPSVIVVFVVRLVRRLLRSLLYRCDFTVTIITFTFTVYVISLFFLVRSFSLVVTFRLRWLLRFSRICYVTFFVVLLFSIVDCSGGIVCLLFGRYRLVTVVVPLLVLFGYLHSVVVDALFADLLFFRSVVLLFRLLIVRC